MLMLIHAAAERTMAFIVSTKILSIAKPIFPFNKYDSNRSEILRGGEAMKRGRFRRMHVSAAVVAQPKLEVGVEVFLLKGSKVLLGRRRTTIGYGDFGLPGGHLEFGESIEACASREVKEETGLEITGCEILTVISKAIFEPEPFHLVGVFMRAELADPAQEPMNLEPEKCDGWNWYDWNHLPRPLLVTLENAISQGLNPFPPK